MPATKYPLYHSTYSYPVFILIQFSVFACFDCFTISVGVFTFKKRRRAFITLQHFWCFVFSLSVHCIQRCEPPGTYSLLSDTTQTNTWYQWCSARRRECRYSLITAWQVNTMNTCAVLCGQRLSLRCFGLIYSVDFSGDHMNHYIYSIIFCLLDPVATWWVHVQVDWVCGWVTCLCLVITPDALFLWP